VWEWLREIADQMTTFPGTIIMTVVVLAEWEDAVVRSGSAITNLGDEAFIILREGDPMLPLEGFDHGAGRRRTKLILMPD
jgi:hypothetical protein